MPIYSTILSRVAAVLLLILVICCIYWNLSAKNTHSRGGSTGRSNGADGARKVWTSTCQPTSTTQERLVAVRNDNKTNRGESKSNAEDVVVLAPITTRNNNAGDACEGNAALYVGHSHTQDSVLAHCDLFTGKNVKRLSKFTVNRRLVQCQPNAYFRRDNYLDKISWVKEFRPPMVNNNINTVVLGSWNWQTNSNYHPDRVRNQIYHGILQARSVLSTKPWKEPFSNVTPQIVVQLPHFLRGPTWGNNLPCVGTEERQRLYSNAVEAAAYQFQEEEMQRSKTPGSPAPVKILVLDMMAWTKHLGRNAGPGGKLLESLEPWEADHQLFNESYNGDENYKKDGAHLQYSRWQEVTQALIQRGVLCAPTRKVEIQVPASLSMEACPELVRSPRNTTKSVVTTLKKMGKWPDLPSCTPESAPNSYFWANLAGLKHFGRKSKGRPGLRNPFLHNWTSGLLRIVQQAKYPRSDVLRHQVEAVLANELSWPDVKDCLNNVGLDDNQTAWSSGRKPMKGNIGYILWRRSGAPLSVKINFLIGYNKEYGWKPRSVPPCVCANRTNLLDDVHVGMLDEANRKGGKAAVAKLVQEIASTCKSALSGFTAAAPTASTRDTVADSSSLNPLA